MIESMLTSATLMVIAVLGIAMYLLPALVAWGRHAPDIGTVAVINVLLGWTVVFWVIALAMALRTASPPGPFVQVVNNPPAAPPPPPLPPPPGWGGPPGPPPLRQSPPSLDLPPRPPGATPPPGRG